MGPATERLAWAFESWVFSTSQRHWWACARWRDLRPSAQLLGPRNLVWPPLWGSPYERDWTPSSHGSEMLWHMKWVLGPGMAWGQKHAKALCWFAAWLGDMPQNPQKWKHLLRPVLWQFQQFLHTGLCFADNLFRGQCRPLCASHLQQPLKDRREISRYFKGNRNKKHLMCSDSAWL